MSQVVITNNAGWGSDAAAPQNTQGFYKGAPGFGVSPHLAALDGAKAMTWFVRYLCWGYVGANENSSSNTPGMLGFPLVTQCSQGSSGTTNPPTHGWGLYATPSTANWIIMSGWNYPINTASTYKRLQFGWGTASFGPVGATLTYQQPACRWNSIAVSMAADGTLLNAADGVGSRAAAAVGTLATPASTASYTVGKALRWFHSIGHGSLCKTAYFPGAAGIWIYAAALTQTQINNLTGGSLDPEDASIIGSLAARSYLGVADWKALRLVARPQVGKRGGKS